MMKRYHILAIAALVTGCSFLDPLPSGNYTDDNINDYPTKVKGFVDKAFDLLPSTYLANEYLYLEGASDNAVFKSTSNAMRLFGIGSASPSNDPFSKFWTRDYTAIYYVNKFLKDDVGYNTHYMIDATADRNFRRMYKGDAFGLRAWYMYDLLSKWGGFGVDGQMLGVPILTENVDLFADDLEMPQRATYDDCVARILADCDSAIVYLPEANRDWLTDDPSHSGAVRWQRLDGVTVKAIKAMTYLLWASPAFNPDGDVTRWRKAAELAAECMKFKLEEDADHGFDPLKAFSWNDPNSTELYWTSSFANSSSYESALYPGGFFGSATIGPSQNLVDAFPMANGYPISDSRSEYDPAKPYEGRDPRFYSSIFHNGSELRRISNNQVMYTFDMSAGGADAPGGIDCSRSGYYQKKFLYLGWNKKDDDVQQAPHCIFFVRWTHMCLAFAEAANKCVGPTTEIGGYTARQALSFIRSRTAQNGSAGIGATSDPYLDECSLSTEMFDALVRNERRIELCFEGNRFFDLRRWGEEINTEITVPVITDEGITFTLLETRSFPSAWLPIPYSEVIRDRNLIQNEGWSNWK